jgi:hypothetical protein
MGAGVGSGGGGVGVELEVGYALTTLEQVVVTVLGPVAAAAALSKMG